MSNTKTALVARLTELEDLVRVRETVLEPPIQGGDVLAWYAERNQWLATYAYIVCMEPKSYPYWAQLPPKQEAR